MRDWVSGYCLQKHGVETEFKAAWDSALWRVGGKIFAMQGAYKDGRPLLTVKLDPAFSEILRARYPGDVIPGYYTDKTHWSSLFLESGVPDDVVRAMLDNGYETTLSKLPKKTQAQIRG